jgi:hypothetical protein
MINLAHNVGMVMTNSERCIPNDICDQFVKPPQVDNIEVNTWLIKL